MVEPAREAEISELVDRSISKPDELMLAKEYGEKATMIPSMSPGKRDSYSILAHLDCS